MVNWISSGQSEANVTSWVTKAAKLLLLFSQVRHFPQQTGDLSSCTQCLSSWCLGNSFFWWRSWSVKIRPEIASGNDYHSYGKSLWLMEKTLYMVIFHSYVSHYQAGYLQKLCNSFHQKARVLQADLWMLILRDIPGIGSKALGYFFRWFFGRFWILFRWNFTWY